MAKKSAIQKNINRKKLVDKNAAKRIKLKKICLDKNISMEERSSPIKIIRVSKKWSKN